MDDKKKKKYTKPDADVVEFKNEDIITISDNNGIAGYDDGEDF